MYIRLEYSIYSQMQLQHDTPIIDTEKTKELYKFKKPYSHNSSIFLKFPRYNHQMIQFHNFRVKMYFLAITN